MKKTLKKQIMWQSVMLVSAAFVIFIIAIAIALPQFNKRAAGDNARSYLQIFEKNITEGGLNTQGDFEALVNLASENLRVTVIGLDGTVIADTSVADGYAVGSHINRPEIQQALDGKIGQSIRKSQTMGKDYLYVATLVETVGDSIVLRVAVPVGSINAYVWPLIGIMGLLFVFVLGVLILVAHQMAKRITEPVSIIKRKLDTIGSSETNPIVLTKHDEINHMLIEVDEISDRLNEAIIGYQSEKHKLELILENINQGIIAIDSERNIIACNKKAQELFGIEFSEPVPLVKIIRNRNLANNIEQAIKNGEYIAFDINMSESETFDIRLLPVVSDKISLIMTIQNVTHLRRTVLEKQQFFSNASHELNTPLSSILGYSELLQSGKGDNKAFAETIHKEATRMKVLIGSMLKIAELEENKQIIDTKLNLKKIVEQVMTAAKPKARAKKIDMQASLEDCNIFANKEKITEVVANLVDNAIKYTGNSGSVSINLSKDRDSVVLSVKDTGIGIPSHALGRVFERFYRVDSGRAKTEGGTGLGLAIVKHICNHYKAPIRLQSKEGVGTEITITFVACD
jgi:two-component system phosphate regulon sensor histidine kinase PhoR